ncbi:MAG: amidohydrolase family protein [Lachnospiraceae bacterium]|nr:amidohydrolase family protein [Lachnospiraceae bacterium]
MYDAHVHIALDGLDYNRMKDVHACGADVEHIRRVFDEYRGAGVGFLRDGGDRWGVSSLAKRLAPEYGIDYRTPAFAIYKKGSYGSILGRFFESFSDFKVLVNSAMDMGADFIKIMGSGIMDFNEYGLISPCTLEKDEIRDMISYCHDKGMSVMVHCNGNDNLTAFVMAGADSIEHGFFMGEDIPEMMAEINVIWIPTVTPVAELNGKPGFNPEVIDKILKSHREMIKKALSLGVDIGTGSDAGSFAVPHKEGAGKEYDYLLDIAKDEKALSCTLTKTKEDLMTRFKRA